MRQFTVLFWLCLGLFVINQVVEKFVHLPIIHAYLDDVLTAPIVLGICLWVFQKILNDEDYTFPVSYILFFLFWYSLFFELIYPSYDARHYQDLWDILAYAIGCFLFYKLGNKPQLVKFVSENNEDGRNAV
jgi:hypothetical protein